MKPARTPAACDLNFPREVRREAYAIERKARASGNWGKWEIIATGDIGTQAGWTSDVHTVARLDWMCVLIRDVHTTLGIVKHGAIRTAMNAELGWREMQRIKDEVFGPDLVAVEVYPMHSRIIDSADMYHLWVLPPGTTLPFGLHSKDPGSDGGYRPEIRSL